jgi:hypothetical protein
MRHPLRVTVAVLLFAAGAVARAAPEPKVEMTVRLPPFIVEQSVGPPWRYVRIPGFEILSRCDDFATRQLALAFHRANQLFGAMVPPSHRLALDAPQALIFYDRNLWSEAEQAAVVVMLRQRAMPPEVRTTEQFFSNLMLADADTITTFALVTASDPGIGVSYLAPGYVRTLIEGKTPAPPAWFVAGFMGLYGRMDFRTQAMSVRLGRWEHGYAPVAGEARDEAPAPLLLGWKELLGVGRPPDPDGDRWQAQVERFLAWGIDPAGGRRDGFWQLVERAAVEPVTEELFRECLGLGFEEARASLAAYVAATQTLRWSLTAETARFPLSIDDASPTDIARIKGEWERLEARYVRKNQPELEPRYAELARRTLHREYDHGGRDPQLLASLGLLELETGDEHAAQGYLEAAVDAGVVRPRAYFELARLRYEQIEGRSTRDDGRFSAAQVESVVQPLLAGLKQAPPLAGSYVLLAYVTARSIEPPAPAVLDALAEGARLFPRHSQLADLRAQLGTSH